MPETLEGITADWLTRALEIDYPGTVVTSATPGSSVRATGTKLRLLLDYNDAGHAHRLPPTMWFKSGLEPHSDYVRSSHEREGLFYSQIAPHGLINAPKGYFAEVDDRGFAGQLIEDLLARNARFGSEARPVGTDAAAQTLTMLARLHAFRWQSSELDKLGAPGGSLITDGIVLHLLTADSWEESMGRPAATELPAAFDTVETVRRGMQQLWDYDSQSNERCIVHGDAHPNNMFFEQDGSPGFLDFQRLMQCDWAHDVNYFLVSCMDTDDAAANERELLEHYLIALKAHGAPALERDAAWENYRRHTMYGLVWNVVPTAMQTERAVDIISRRFNAAARRHELAGLFDLG